MKGTYALQNCQGRLRLGRVTTHKNGASSGHVLIPIEQQEEGFWALRGVLKIGIRELVFRWFPCSHKWRRRLIRRALSAGRRALGEVAA